MKLNANLLRARRMELGLTSREVARDAMVSQGLVKRMEDTGDAAVLQVKTLTAILDILCLDLVEAQEPPAKTRDSADDLVETIGSLLHERRSSVPLVEIASILRVTLDKIEPALNVLDDLLRPVGQRVRRNSGGASIATVVREGLGSGNENERLRYLSNLNKGDLALLYRAMTTQLPANTVAGTVNGNINLQKLEGAGLAKIVNNRICMTPELRATLES